MIVRFLYTWYSTQRYFIKWCNILSQSFTVRNGVRQGGILSSFLFNVYVDELSCKLSTQSSGCFIEQTCFNHLFYADDTVLLSPSPSGLQKLINVCTNYGKNHEILYNARKTVCMAFRPKIILKHRLPSMFLNDKLLNWAEEHTYLGFYFTFNDRDDKDIKRQLRYLYAKGNVLCRHFVKCNDQVKLLLFRSYFYNLYCCQLWSNYTLSQFNACKVAFNNVFRNLFGIRKQCSMSELYVKNNIDSFYVVLRKSIVRFRSRLYGSKNTLLISLLQSPRFYNSSRLYKEWAKRIF